MARTLFSCALTALLFSGRSFAAPTLKPRSVSDSLFTAFELFEQYSAAAYCSSNYDSSTTGDELTCDEDDCDTVEAATTKTLLEFEHQDSTDVAGYVALDETNNYLVVAFRGSSSIRNWITDLTFGLTDTDLCDDCQAHSGFWDSWESARGDILSSIESAIDDYSGYTLVVTGHSLGGAIATLAAAELRNAGYTAALYTYGSPRVGNEELCTYITDQSGGNYRVTHYDDPVPRLPPHAWGFDHVSPEYWITTGNDETVTASDIEVIDGLYSTSGNSGTSGLDIDAHLWYFQSIADCASFTLKSRKL
ncbi:MAG: hypothetical protein M1834_008212 [Cirrosporium novae-zelandiae]|nr:MAG: hypothetical protein M1834_008212 [Cirrosporium novae-zelandiae]